MMVKMIAMMLSTVDQCPLCSRHIDTLLNYSSTLGLLANPLDG